MIRGKDRIFFGLLKNRFVAFCPRCRIQDVLALKISYTSSSTKGEGTSGGRKSYNKIRNPLFDGLTSGKSKLKIAKIQRSLIKVKLFVIGKDELKVVCLKLILF